MGGGAHPDRPAAQFFHAAAGEGAKDGSGRSHQAAYPDRPDHDLLAFAFAAAWSVTGAMAAHLPRILEAAGATSLQAGVGGALIARAGCFRIVEANFLTAIIALSDPLAA